ncbi:MAG TPA: hypothetical protein VM840_03910 [Actinomycetota bacterium]|nr:hypothetical protein [Actinomycetota bacterium]
MSDRQTKRPRPARRRRPAEVLSAVRPVVDQLAAERDLVVWDVTFRMEAGRDTLAVALDRLGGVGSDEIAGFAESLSRALDAEDAVPGEARYVLEVSSPGAERKLSSPEQFGVCVGRPVRITFRDERPPLEATIVAADEAGVSVDGGEGTERVAFEEISQARLSVRGV